MKLNEINFDLLSDQELIVLCLKYKIIEKEDISKTTRKELLNIIKGFLQKKLFLGTWQFMVVLRLIKNGKVILQIQKQK